MPVARNSRKFFRSAGLPLEERYVGFASDYRARMLPALLPGTDGAKALDTYRRRLAAPRGADPLHRLRYVLKAFLPSLSLACTDPASMAASVEVPVPMLDHRLVECAAALAADLLSPGRRQRYTFKQTAARSLEWSWDRGPGGVKSGAAITVPAGIRASLASDAYLSFR